MNCLIVFRSMTLAQSAVQILKRNAITSTLIRPPAALGKGSCSYGVQVRELDLGRARKAISSLNLNILGVHQQLPGGRYREVL